MRLYNQTKDSLRYDNTAGVLIEWEPFGAAEVPDNLAQALKESGFRVDVAPIPPETKAAAVVEAAADEQRRDVVERLKSDLAAARASENAAKVAAEEAMGQFSALNKAAEDARAAQSAAELKLAMLNQDKTALEELLTETAKKLESAESRAAQAEALASSDVNTEGSKKSKKTA